jgi:glycosyltransferase involved in cell wall biosynthesis
VLLLIDSLGVGGTERQAVELLGGLRASGRFDVRPAVIDSGGAWEPVAVARAGTVLRLDRRGRYDVRPVFRLLAAVRREGIALIHGVGWMSGWAGLLAARAAGIPCVCATMFSDPTRRDLQRRLRRWCAKLADAGVANSAAALAAHGLRGHPRAVVIHNGVDMDRFGVRRAPADPPTIVMLANFTPYKDHHTVVEALLLLRRDVPDARLLLIGRDGGTLATTTALIARRGLVDAVRIVTDSIAPEPLLATSHVGVLSSPSEGFSNALLEYMAAGLPVIATACPGNTEVVRDGDTGYVVPFGSAPALAARCVALLRDPTRAAAMGRAGRAHAVAHFSRARQVAAYEALYDALLVGSRRHRRLASAG